MAKSKSKRQVKSKPASKTPVEAPKYPPPYEYRFNAGPYTPPQIGVGTMVEDEYAGSVKCVGVSESPIPWPAYKCSAGRRSSPMPILTAGLVRAVCEESELVVAHYWGVTRHMVNRWKCAIAKTEDSNEVAVNIALLKSTPEFRARYGYAT